MNRSSLHPRRIAWAWQVLGIYLVSRIVATTALLIARTHQGDSFDGWWPGEQPPYGVFVARWWDGWWYEQVALHGYPSQLPLDELGAVDLNEWAFYPLYPGIVRGLMELTGGTWIVLAPLVSMVLGAAALLVIYRVVEVGAPRAVAARPGLPLATVAVVAFFPSAVVLQVAYTESLALLLVATSLLLLIQRRYEWAMLAVALLGFTRAIALPMAAVIAVHLALRWWNARAGAEEFSRRDRLRGLLLLVVAGVSGVLWLGITALGTGELDAYFQTQAAWRPGRGSGLFMGWLRLSTFSPIGVVLAVGAVVGIIALLLSPAGRRLGVELWTWTAVYVLFLATVGDVISSQLRFLLLAFPLAIALVGLIPRPRWAARTWTGVLIVGFAVGMVAWVWTVWMQVLLEITFLKAP